MVRLYNAVGFRNLGNSDRDSILRNIMVDRISGCHNVQRFDVIRYVQVVLRIADGADLSHIQCRMNRSIYLHIFMINDQFLICDASFPVY